MDRCRRPYADPAERSRTLAEATRRGRRRRLDPLVFCIQLHANGQLSVLLRQACEALKIVGVREDGAGFVETGHGCGQRSRALAAMS